MAAKWNARPAYTEKPLLGSQVSKSAALQSVASYGAVAVVAALTSRYGYVSVLQGLQSWSAAAYVEL